MLFKRKSPQKAPPRAVRDEILSLCRHEQITRLQLARHLQRDFDLDCGCANAFTQMHRPR